MAGPVAVPDFGIVLRALIGVPDRQRNRRAGGDQRFGIVLIGQITRQDLDLVGFLALGRMARLAGLALVELGLDFGKR